ncbi:MAG: S8 family serine peptidase [Erysipelotrichaceae bacterium]|nr:S8 family serine peptidase [Erysipelotrichaceae bacterium]
MAKKSHLLRNIIFVLLILVIGVALGVAMFFFFGDTSSNQFDEDNVGEIYYQEIDEEHVSNIDDYISYVDNEILVVASDGVSYSKIEKLAKSYDASIVGYIEQTGDYQLELNDTYTVEELEELIAQLENEDMIDSASINYITEVSENEIHYGDEWSEDIADTSLRDKSWSIEVIDACESWTLLDNADQSTINPVRIGLIDNGFDDDHEDLGFAETFYNENYDASANSEASHGTHVAGTMAANSNDDTGICGVYPYGDGNLYGVSIKGIESYSENNVSSMSYKIAFAELIFRNVKVINVSMTWSFTDDAGNSTDYSTVINNWNTSETGQYCEEISDDLGNFLNRLLEKGYDFIITCIAGNHSSVSTGHLESKYNSILALIEEENYPEVYNRILVVGAINSSLEVSSFSNGGDRTDIYAPGGEYNNPEEGYEIYSTVAAGYGYKVGTSMASPAVAGVAATVWSIDNSLTGAEVKDLVISNTVTLSNVKVVNALIASAAALTLKEDDGNSSSVDYGGILCWVVNSDDEDEKISGATVTATNKDTGERESTTTDSYGHFELILAEGEYTLTVTADDYEDYTIDNVEVKAAGINYLDDWIKMTKVMTNDDIKELYKDFIDNKEYSSNLYNLSQLSYSYFDVNDDNVIDLIIRGYSGKDNFYIYSYKDDQIVELGNFENSANIGGPAEMYYSNTENALIVYTRTSSNWFYVLYKVTDSVSCYAMVGWENTKQMADDGSGYIYLYSLYYSEGTDEDLSKEEYENYVDNLNMDEITFSDI